jgi:hypothetical protein
MFCTDFNYSSAYELAKQEIVYYFHRLSLRGIYYDLYKEFEKELAQPYSILPLFRPTRSNPSAVLAMREEALKKGAAMNQVCSSLLQKTADIIPEGKQVMARDKTTRESKDIHGKRILGAPDNSQKDATLAILTQSGNANESQEQKEAKKRKKKRKHESSITTDSYEEGEGDVADTTALMNGNTKTELTRLAAIEGVQIRASHNKQKIARAIIVARAKK